MDELKKHIPAALLGIVVGSLGTFIGGYALGWAQSREAQLVHEDFESLPIQEKEISTAIYHIKLENTGNKEAEEAVCTVNIPGDAVIERHKVACPPSMARSEEVKQESLTEKFANFNPGEEVQISVLVTSKSALPPKPSVSFRGKGVNGIEKHAQVTRRTNTSSFSYYFQEYSPALIIPIFATLSISMYAICNFFIKRIAHVFTTNEVEVEILDESRIKIRILKGFGQPRAWMTLTTGDTHELTGLSYLNLRSRGAGIHTIQSKI